MAWAWNYRIMRSGVGDLQAYYISEVYYENGRITGWTDAISPIGETADGLRSDVALMVEGLRKPVLIQEDLDRMYVLKTVRNNAYCGCGFGHSSFDHTDQGCTWAGCPCTLVKEAA